MYIWQSPDWPRWRYQLDEISPWLEQASRLQGCLYGRLADVGFEVQEQTSLSALTEDVVKSSAIEGEVLSPESVRSSIARRLGLEQSALAPIDRHVDGIVQMMCDATSRANEPLTVERLFGWHAALFPNGYSGLVPITVGDWRSDALGPMQVVSGPLGVGSVGAVLGSPRRPKVHYEAPPAGILSPQMQIFLDWVNQPNPSQPGLIRAAIGHLWFVTLHPFDDGNGRIGRAVGDLLLARADRSNQRFYSVSAQIQAQRKAYYDILEYTQKSSMDITPWLLWFLNQLVQALQTAHATVDSALVKTKFWHHWAGVSLNPRQIKILNRLLDGFDARLTTSRWGSMTKCSADTALRDITQLIELGILQRSIGGGRSTSYELTQAHR